MSSLAGRRALITSASRYMGPAIQERFARERMDVLLDDDDYLGDETLPARIVAKSEPLDILIVNLLPADLKAEAADRVTEGEWSRVFRSLADPTMRFVTAALPGMIARRRGKIVVVTSVAPLQPRALRASYTAARGAQNAYVQAVGREVARHNVQVNAIAQSYVYGGFPADFMDDAANRAIVERDVPAGRLAEGWEQAALVRFLVSDESDFISGQVVPFSGGRVVHT